jgi:hypothetical protein
MSLTCINCRLCVGPEKAAEHLLFPSPFWYFLGQCQKGHRENGH